MTFLASTPAQPSLAGLSFAYKLFVLVDLTFLVTALPGSRVSVFIFSTDSEWSSIILFSDCSTLKPIT